VAAYPLAPKAMLGIIVGLRGGGPCHRCIQFMNRWRPRYAGDAEVVFLSFLRFPSNCDEDESWWRLNLAQR